MKFKFLIVALLSLAARPEASAFTDTSSSDGIFFEPVLAYSSGVVTQAGVYDIVTQVVSAEARAGYKISGFSLSLSYLMGFGTGEQFGNKGDFKPSDIGVSFGCELPFSFRLLGSYLFNSTAKIQSILNPGDFSGTGTRIGLAYMGLPFGTTLAIEAIARKYAKYESAELKNSLQDSTMSVSLGYTFE